MGGLGKLVPMGAFKGNGGGTLGLGRGMVSVVGELFLSSCMSSEGQDVFLLEKSL